MDWRKSFILGAVIACIISTIVVHTIDEGLHKMYNNDTTVIKSTAGSIENDITIAKVKRDSAPDFIEESIDMYNPLYPGDSFMDGDSIEINYSSIIFTDFNVNVIVYINNRSNTEYRGIKPGNSDYYTIHPLSGSSYAVFDLENIDGRIYLKIEDRKRDAQTETEDDTYKIRVHGPSESWRYIDMYSGEAEIKAGDRFMDGDTLVITRDEVAKEGDKYKFIIEIQNLGGDYLIPQSVTGSEKVIAPRGKQTIYEKVVDDGEIGDTMQYTLEYDLVNRDGTLYIKYTWNE